MMLLHLAAFGSGIRNAANPIRVMAPTRGLCLSSNLEIVVVIVPATRAAPSKAALYSPDNSSYNKAFSRWIIIFTLLKNIILFQAELELVDMVEQVDMAEMA